MKHKVHELTERRLPAKFKRRQVLCNSSFKKLNADLARKILPGKSYEGGVRNHVVNGRILEAVVHGED